METSTGPSGEYMVINRGGARFTFLQIVPAAVLLIGIQFLPYSPVCKVCVQLFRMFTLHQRWLLEVNRDDEARKIVYELHGDDTPEAKSAAEFEYAEMHDQIKADALVRSRKLSDLWATPAMLRRTLVAVGVQAFTQFTGINGESSSRNRGLCF